MSLPQIDGYRLQRLIARGSMGRVYEAVETSLQRTVAIKLLADPLDPEQLQRFSEEARSVASLAHPGIARVFAFATTPAGDPYLAMEYLPGGTLAEAIRGRILPGTAAARLVATLADAVQAAHDAGIIHRDLKPGNILFAEPPSRTTDTHPQHRADTAPDLNAILSSSGSSAEAAAQLQAGAIAPAVAGSPPALDILKPDPISIDPAMLRIVDFGLARRLTSDARMTRTGQVMGTPAYMAPEQASGITRQPGPAADVYSLGAILYELIAGRPPFLGADALDTMMRVLSEDPQDPRVLQPDIPLDLQTICLKCLEKSPARRYSSARALAEDLRRFLNGEPVTARPVSAATRLTRWIVRNPWKSVTAVALLISTLAAVAGLIVVRRTSNELVAANAQLKTAVTESDTAFQLTQDTLERIVNRVRDDLYEVPQATRLMLTTSQDSAALLRQLHQLRPDDLTVRRQLIESLTTLANAEWVYGSRDESRKATAQLGTVLEESLRRVPDDPELQTQWLKFLLEKVQFPAPDATDQSRAADRRQLQQLCDTLLAEPPTEPLRMQLAVQMAQLQMNEAKKAGNDPEYLRFAQSRIDAARRYYDLATGEEQNSAAVWYVQALRVLANALIERDRADEAEALLLTAVNVLESETDAADDREFRYRRALVDVDLVHCRAAQRMLVESSSLLDQILPALRRLVSDFPEDSAYSLLLATACSHGAEVARRRHGWPDAGDVVSAMKNEAEQLLGSLLQAEPENPDALQLRDRVRAITMPVVAGSANATASDPAPVSANGP